MVTVHNMIELKAFIEVREIADALIGPTVNRCKNCDKKLWLRHSNVATNMNRRHYIWKQWWDGKVTCHDCGVEYTLNELKRLNFIVADFTFWRIMNEIEIIANLLKGHCSMESTCDYPPYCCDFCPNGDNIQHKCVQDDVFHGYCSFIENGDVLNHEDCPHWVSSLEDYA
jgi:hypothetical protein